MFPRYRGAFGALVLVFTSVSYCAPAAGVSTAAPAGGWSPAPLQDENVKRAAQFALESQERQTRIGFKLLAIKHARQQAATGTNYSMNLMVQTEGKRRLVIAEVWVKPDGSQQLTRWHWV